jgi:hypothetical protein
MLNKDVCKQCINAVAHKNALKNSNLIWCEWGDIDDSDWDKNKVVECRSRIFHAYRVDVTQPPPKHCKYALEHIVSDRHA